MPKDATITLRLPADLKAALEADAKRDQRSLSGQIVWMLTSGTPAPMVEPTPARVAQPDPPAPTPKPVKPSKAARIEAKAAELWVATTEERNQAKQAYGRDPESRLERAAFYHLAHDLKLIGARGAKLPAFKDLSYAEARSRSK
jgi:hypothetical protein